MNVGRLMTVLARRDRATLRRGLLVCCWWLFFAGVAGGVIAGDLSHVEVRGQVIECRWIAGELHRIYEESYGWLEDRSPESGSVESAEEFIWRRVSSGPSYLAVLRVDESRPLLSEGVLSEWEPRGQLVDALLAPQFGGCHEGRFLQGALYEPLCDTSSPACLLKVKTMMPAPSLESIEPKGELQVSFDYYDRVRWQSFGAGVLAGISLGLLALFVFSLRRAKSPLGVRGETHRE